jgi:putative transposase
LSFLQELEKEVAADLQIHLILNYSTHKSQAVQRWLQPKKRQCFHLHFAPTSSSWLNQVRCSPYKRARSWQSVSG